MPRYVFSLAPHFSGQDTSVADQFDRRRTYSLRDFLSSPVPWRADGSPKCTIVPKSRKNYNVLHNGDVMFEAVILHGIHSLDLPDARQPVIDFLGRIKVGNE